MTPPSWTITRIDIMDHLNNWFKANQLLLNMSKTVLISFWDNKGELKVLVDDTKIPNVQATKFLGVTVDHTLSWDAHVNNLLDKLVINKHLLAVSSKLLNLDSLKLIYYAHIQSHLVNGLSAWGNMTSSNNITKIFKMQKACAKMARKQPKRAPVLQMFKNLKLLTTYIFRTLQIWIHPGTPSNTSFHTEYTKQQRCFNPGKPENI